MRYHAEYGMAEPPLSAEFARGLQADTRNELINATTSVHSCIAHIVRSDAPPFGMQKINKGSFAGPASSTHPGRPRNKGFQVPELSPGERTTTGCQLRRGQVLRRSWRACRGEVRETGRKSGPVVLAVLTRSIDIAPNCRYKGMSHEAYGAAIPGSKEHL